MMPFWNLTQLDNQRGKLRERTLEHHNLHSTHTERVDGGNECSHSSVDPQRDWVWTETNEKKDCVPQSLCGSEFIYCDSAKVRGAVTRS